MSIFINLDQKLTTIYRLQYTFVNALSAIGGMFGLLTPMGAMTANLYSQINMSQSLV